MESIQVENLNFSVGGFGYIRDLSYDFPVNQLIGILAPVEEMYSFILKIIGGILEPTSGRVLIDGVDLHNAPTSETRLIRKDISYAFDRGGLISNLSIAENLFLPLDFHYPDISREEKKDKIHGYLDKFKIPETVLTARPAGLHPQMTKILLLIRAFITEPKIILYDSPMNDLELRLKKQVLRHIKEINERRNVTQLFVSTSDNLFELSDHILVMAGGEFVEEGKWESLIRNGKSVTQRIIREYLEIGINET